MGHKTIKQAGLRMVVSLEDVRNILDIPSDWKLRMQEEIRHGSHHVMLLLSHSKDTFLSKGYLLVWETVQDLVTHKLIFDGQNANLGGIEGSLRDFRILPWTLDVSAPLQNMLWIDITTSCRAVLRAFDECDQRMADDGDVENTRRLQYLVTQGAMLFDLADTWITV